MLDGEPLNAELQQATSTYLHPMMPFNRQLAAASSARQEVSILTDTCGL